MILEMRAIAEEKRMNWSCSLSLNFEAQSFFLSGELESLNCFFKRTEEKYRERECVVIWGAKRV